MMPLRILIGYLLIITSRLCSAITNRQQALHYDAGSVRNFRHIPGPSSESSTDWETGLKEATLQTLLRDGYRDANLRERLLAAPLYGRRDAASKFGDVVVLARGQLYAVRAGALAFVQDARTNEHCDDCFNARRCDNHQCQPWTRQNQELLLALWTVKRLRHRDFHGNSRYEIEYTVSPINDITRDFVIRKGRFNYAIPGHVFVIKSGESNENAGKEYDQEIYNRKIPHNHYIPNIPIGYDSTGHRKVLHSYPGFFTSGVGLPPQQTTTKTTDSEEIELYEKLIEALASKTSTTVQAEEKPQRMPSEAVSTTTASTKPTKKYHMSTKKPVYTLPKPTKPQTTSTTAETTRSTTATTAKTTSTTVTTTKSTTTRVTTPSTTTTTVTTARTTPTTATTSINAPTTATTPRTTTTRVTTPKTITTRTVTTQRTTTKATPRSTSTVTTPKTTTTTTVTTQRTTTKATPRSTTTVTIPRTTTRTVTIPRTTATSPRTTTITSPRTTTTTITTPGTTEVMTPKTTHATTTSAETTTVTTPKTTTTTTTEATTSRTIPSTASTSRTTTATTPRTTTTTTTTEATPKTTITTATTSKTTAITDNTTVTTTRITPTTVTSTTTAPTTTSRTTSTSATTSRTTSSTATTPRSTTTVTTTRTTASSGPKPQTVSPQTTTTTEESTVSTTMPTLPTTTERTTTATTQIVSMPPSTMTTTPTTLPTIPKTTTISSSEQPDASIPTTTVTMPSVTVVVTSESGVVSSAEVTSRIPQAELEIANETESPTMVYAESASMETEPGTEPTDQMPPPITDAQTTPYSNIGTGTTTTSPGTKTTSRTTTSSDFLTEVEPIREPIDIRPVKGDYDLDDIFGPTRATAKPPGNTTSRPVASDLEIQLFGERDLRDAKVIFANFYAASTASTPRKYDGMTAESEPLTSQSYETSISYRVSKRKAAKEALEAPNKSKYRRYKPLGAAPPSSATAFTTSAYTEATSTIIADGTTEYTSKEENPATEAVPRGSTESTREALDDLAMRLVNHARSIDFTSRSWRPTRRRYKKRTYSPRSGKPTRKRVRSR